MCMPQYISLGENCLPDDVLTSLGRKGHSFPFGSGRFNIEVVTQVVATDFKDLLNPAFLTTTSETAQRHLRNTAYRHKNDIYAAGVSDGFEFTHHNVLEDAPRRSFLRKIDRFRKTMRGSANVVFVYHYRNNPNLDIKKVASLLEQFLFLIETQYGRRPKCTLWHQTLAPASDRGLEIRMERSILVANFITLADWSGDEMWNGSADRDLFAKFFENPVQKRFAIGPLYRFEPVLKFGARVISRIGRAIAAAE